jgi:hypothetical protein
MPSRTTVHSGAQRHPKDMEAVGRSALDGDLGGLKAGAPEGWLSRAGAVGGCDGRPPGTGGARGSAQAAARRAPQGAKAELPVRLRRISLRALAPAPAERNTCDVVRLGATSYGITRRTARGSQSRASAAEGAGLNAQGHRQCQDRRSRVELDTRAPPTGLIPHF